MKIIDLPKEHEQSYFLCLEDWSKDAQESGDHKARWYAKMKQRGLRVKLAVDGNGVPGGMIQYLPAEQSTIDAPGLYFITCTWIHGYKQGRGNFQKKGMGSALLSAAEEDARALGAKGIAAWGLILPFWMKASWYRKHGFKPAQRSGIMQLVWKPFASDARPPKWIKPVKKPSTIPGKVAVTAFTNGWCLVQNLNYERTKRACEELGDKAVFQGIDTSEPEVIREWGISDGLFIDGKRLMTGPPMSYEKIKKLIEKRVNKL